MKYCRHFSNFVSSLKCFCVYALIRRSLVAAYAFSFERILGHAPHVGLMAQRELIPGSKKGVLQSTKNTFAGAPM